jgi:signal transduction histidine kinase
MAGWVNLVAGVTQIVVALAIVFELVRLRRGFPLVALLLISFFAIDGLVALNRPDPVFGYSPNLDAILIVIDLVVLVVLLACMRQLARAVLRTVDEASIRASEYERARRDYASLLRHRIANPLMAIEGAARTLRARRGEEQKEQLLETIIEASQSLERISLDPKLRGLEEADLEPLPRLGAGGSAGVRGMQTPARDRARDRPRPRARRSA